MKSTIPFVLIGGAGIINNQGDIIMLGWFRPTEEVGIYRVAVQGATLVAFGLQATSVIVAPQFARLFAQGDMVRLQRLVTMSARAILLAALPVALAFMVAGGAIAGWVFGSEYKTSHLPLAILAAGQLGNAAFGFVGLLLNMTGHERYTARTLWQTAILNLVLNAILIPRYGLNGAALATAVTLFIWKILLWFTVRRKLGIDTSLLNLRIIPVDR